MGNRFKMTRVCYSHIPSISQAHSGSPPKNSAVIVRKPSLQNFVSVSGVQNWRNSFVLMSGRGVTRSAEGRVERVVINWFWGWRHS